MNTSDAQAVSTTIASRASIDVRAVVLPRAGWEYNFVNGTLAVMPKRGTWYGHVVRKSAWETIVIPMIGCPACGGLLMLSHTPETAKAISQYHGGVRVPVAHRIDYLGKVSPDILCKHGRCDFHRRVYLDKWNKTKALWAIAYDDGKQIQIDYCHAVDRKEAIHQYNAGSKKGCHFIDAGPAVGFFVNEKTGKVTAD